MPLNLATFQIPRRWSKRCMSELEPIIKSSNLTVRAIMPRGFRRSRAIDRRSSRSSSIC